MPPQPVTDDDTGVKVLVDNTASHIDGVVDVLAVHGRGAHPNHTWCHLRHGDLDIRNPDNYINWLSDPAMLPAVLPHARIMTYGYHSSWFGEQRVITSPRTISQDLLLQLKLVRVESPRRLLIVVAHSFGGLVVLQSLLDAHDERARWPEVYGSVIGLIFFGTPFRGSSALTQREILRLAMQEFEEQEVLVDELRTSQVGDESLITLVERYLRMTRHGARPKTACFYEQRPTNVTVIVNKNKSPYYGVWVDESSGTLDISDSVEKYSRACHHLNINKFQSPEHGDFKKLASVLREMVGLRSVVPSSGNRIVTLRMDESGSTPAQKWMAHFAGQLTRSNGSLTNARDLIDRISTYDSRAVLNRQCRKRHAGTITWLAETVAFKGWQAVSILESILWISGKVGSGKTVACAAAVEHLFITTSPSDDTQMLHYFFDRPTDRPIDIFRSLTKQALQYNADRNEPCSSTITRELEKSFGDSNRNPDLQDMIQYILIPLTSNRKIIYICIDGIDDMTDHNDHQVIWSNLSNWARRRTSQSLVTRILISSESGSALSTLLPQDTVEIQIDRSLVSADIQIYIEDRLQEHSRPGQLFSDAPLRKRIQERLIAQADNMFLWVHLQMEEILLECNTPAEVDATLDDMPSTLTDTYLRCMGRMRNGKLMRDSRVLSWCVAAKAALDIDEVREMLAVHPQTGEIEVANIPSAESVVRSGVSLVVLEQTEKILVPTHHSVRNFLFSQLSLEMMTAKLNERGVTRGEVSNEVDTYLYRDAQLEIGRMSLLHIKARTGLELQQPYSVVAPPLVGSIPRVINQVLRWRQTKPNVLRVPPPRRVPGVAESSFLKYAVRTWTLHTEEVSPDSPTWDLFRTIALRPNTSYRVHPWTAVAKTDNAHLRGLFGYAVSHNHLPLLQLIKDEPKLLPQVVYDHVLPGNDLLPAIHVASKAGYAEVVKILRHLVKMDSLCPVLRRTALHYVCENGHYDVVKYLVKYLQGNLNHQDAENSTALISAAEMGHEEVVRFLLGRKEVDATVMDDLGRTAFWWAAFNGHRKTVETLLNTSRLTGAVLKDDAGQTPLMSAAGRGNLGIVQLLLDSKASDLYQRDRQGKTALIHAASGGRTAVVRAMLAHPFVDPDARDNEECSALWWAVHHGHAEIVSELLATHKVNTAIRNSQGRTMLWEAVQGNRAEILWELLQYGQLTTVEKDKWGRTPLEWAEEQGHEQTVQVLLAWEDRLVRMELR